MIFIDFRLSQRTSSLKPVAASGSDEDVRAWGSCTDLKPLSAIKEESVRMWGSRTELGEAPSLPRSPSLPSLPRVLETPRHGSGYPRLAGLGLTHELRTPKHTTLNSSQRAPLQSITPRQHTLTTVSICCHFCIACLGNAPRKCHNALTRSRGGLVTVWGNIHEL